MSWLFRGSAAARNRPPRRAVGKLLKGRRTLPGVIVTERPKGDGTAKRPVCPQDLTTLPTAA